MEISTKFLTMQRFYIIKEVRFLDENLIAGVDVFVVCLLYKELSIKLKHVISFKFCLFVDFQIAHHISLPNTNCSHSDNPPHCPISLIFVNPFK